MKKKMTNQDQRRRFNYYNQLHKPRKSYNEEQKVRMFLKSGTSTMLLCRGMAGLAATSLALYIERFCKQHQSKLEGHFIFTK